MVKRAQMYYKDSCSVCEEAKVFMEDNGVLLKIRDVSETPLTKRELLAILGYHNPKHYLDSTSATYRKKKFEKMIPSHAELMQVIEDHPDLLKYPIVMAGRLMTIGANRQQLTDMLQLSASDNVTGYNDNNRSRRSNKK